jgi:hypothetical protein
MDARFVTYEKGSIHDYEDRCVIAYLVRATAELKAANESLHEET